MFRPKRQVTSIRLHHVISQKIEPCLLGVFLL
jgi:hypothetical protein